jgi:D-amino-acid dehydrogenase
MSERTPQKPKLIIGGGLIGIAIWFELSRRGVPALLLEAEEDLALETSFANGGMMPPSQSEPWNGPGVLGHLLVSLFDPMAAMKLRLHAIPQLAGWGLSFLRNSTPKRYQKAAMANFELARFSAQCTAEVTSDHGLQYDQAQRGCLKLLRTGQAMETSLAITRKFAECGLEYQTLAPDQVLEKVPQLSAARGKIAGGLFYSGDGVADARLFSLQLAKAAQKLGGELHTGVRVHSWILEKGSIVGVKTNKGDFKGEGILAAGTGSRGLAKLVGVHLPVQPAKGYSLTVDAKGLGNDMPNIPVLDEAMHTAVVPIGERLRLVGTAEFDGYQKTIHEQRIENLRQVFVRLYPNLVPKLDWEAALPWAGLRPMSSDGVPIIGPSPVSGLWLNCGHGHLGWTMAMGSARLLVSQMLGETVPLEVKNYQFGR